MKGNRVTTGVGERSWHTSLLLDPLFFQPFCNGSSPSHIVSSFPTPSALLAPSPTPFPSYLLCRTFLDLLIPVAKLWPSYRHSGSLQLSMLPEHTLQPFSAVAASSMRILLATRPSEIGIWVIALSISKPLLLNNWMKDCTSNLYAQLMDLIGHICTWHKAVLQKDAAMQLVGFGKHHHSAWSQVQSYILSHSDFPPRFHLHP